MYSLLVTCAQQVVDLVSYELWEAGTIGVREIEAGEGRVKLVAAFETNAKRDELLRKFRECSAQWMQEADTDWAEATRLAWPGRAVGTRLFLTAPWCEEVTPEGRERVIHNPGLACGTGEHPCTQLACEALEQVITPGCSVADIGTGSGILAIAALRLGAALAIGVDVDEAAIGAADENFDLNGLSAALAVGSAECLAEDCVQIAVANISASVLLSIADDLLRIVRPEGALILTGFLETEAETVQKLFGPARTVKPARTVQMDGWCCLISQPSSSLT